MRRHERSLRGHLAKVCPNNQKSQALVQIVRFRNGASVFCSLVFEGLIHVATLRQAERKMKTDAPANPCAGSAPQSMVGSQAPVPSQDTGRIVRFASTRSSTELGILNQCSSQESRLGLGSLRHAFPLPDIALPGSRVDRTGRLKWECRFLSW